MRIFIQTFAVAFVLTSDYCASQRHQPWSCDVALNPNSRRYNCYYRCYSTSQGWINGTHKDGMPCMLWRNPMRRAQCLRGVCVSEDTGPSANTTDRPPQFVSCDGEYRGKGYAPNCRYTCTLPNGRRKLTNYALGTPCMPLNENGQRAGNAGICYFGKCHPYDQLERRFPNITKKVHPAVYRKCPLKENYAKIVLWSCIHYCKIQDEWFYGYYGSGTNNACQLFREDNRLGWCCDGSCHLRPHCGQDLEDTNRVGK
uniref:18.3 kDa family n=1 Tax=Rhipicephalus zambeziensis TaxID=60191 RepID=A0A224Y0Q3_9ACAR